MAQMKMVQVRELQIGELFAKSGGPSAEIGKVLAQNFATTVYEDEYGYICHMQSKFIVWVDA